jgi:hypothetical protein
MNTQIVFSILLIVQMSVVEMQLLMSVVNVVEVVSEKENVTVMVMC